MPGPYEINFDIVAYRPRARLDTDNQTLIIVSGKDDELLAIVSTGRGDIERPIELNVTDMQIMQLAFLFATGGTNGEFSDELVAAYGWKSLDPY